VSEERERDRASPGSLEIITIMARREEGDGSRRTAAAAAAAAAATGGMDVAMEGVGDRLVTLPSTATVASPVQRVARRRRRKRRRRKGEK